MQQYYRQILAVLSLYLLLTASRINHPIEDTQIRCSHHLGLSSLLSLVLIKVCGQISDGESNSVRARLLVVEIYTRTLKSEARLWISGVLWFSYSHHLRL